MLKQCVFLLHSSIIQCRNYLFLLQTSIIMCGNFLYLLHSFKATVCRALIFIKRNNVLLSQHCSISLITFIHHETYHSCHTLPAGFSWPPPQPLQCLLQLHLRRAPAVHQDMLTTEKDNTVLK